MNDFEVHPIGTAQRLAELERDAARYRWLRQNRFIWSDFSHIANGHKKTVGLEFGWFPTKDEKPTRESLDAAIDAAMGEAK